MTRDVALVALAILANCNQLYAYNVEFYDCRDISKLSTYRVSKACSPRTLERTKTVEYTLLQRRDILDMKGYSCRISRSTLTEYCGAYSHTKLVKTPDIDVVFPVSPEACLNIVNTGVFTTPSGTRHKITFNAENVIKSEDRGTLTIGDNSVACRGQSMKFGAFIVEDILEVSQYKLIIIKEKFLVSSDNRVETYADHLRLPTRCSVTSRGCQTHDTTYVWIPPRNLCNLEEVRTVHMETDRDYLVDPVNKVLLKTGSSIPAPTGCPTTLLYATEYSNLFLAKPGVKWPPMKDDADITLFIKARDDYIAYKLEQRIAKQEAQIQSRTCYDSLRDQQNGLIQLDGPYFLKRNGDTVEHFKCKERKAPILDLEVCHDTIPIEGGFVKVPSRVFTAHSAPRPCNKHFGLKILSSEGVWIELNPEAKKIPEPADLPAIDHDLHHEDLSDGGIYSEAELESWTRHIELGDIVDAVTRSITYGVCQAQDECESHPAIPSYDLSILTQGANMVPLGLWQRIDSSLKHWGGYVSLLVLLIELWRFGLVSIMIGLAFAADGMIGVKALVYRVLCGTRTEAERVARRHQRLKRRRESDGAEEQMFLQSHETAKPRPDL